jgi:hypothetical protein
MYARYCDRNSLKYVLLSVVPDLPIDVTRDVGDTLHIINVEKNVSRLPFHFFLLPYLCLHTVGLVRMEVV